jgi:hypothetical protein
VYVARMGRRGMLIENWWKDKKKEPTDDQEVDG